MPSYCLQSTTTKDLLDMMEILGKLKISSKLDGKKTKH